VLARDDTFSRADFTFDQERTICTGPEGKPSTCTSQVHDGGASVRGQADSLRRVANRPRSRFAVALIPAMFCRKQAARRERP